MKLVLFNWNAVIMKEQFLTRQNVFVSVLVFVLCSLALFATVEKLALLLLQGLNERKQGESNFKHTTSRWRRIFIFFVTKNSQITQTGSGEVHNNSTRQLTSNSSQKPCLTLSVASASLLSSRTRLSISAALIRVVFRGCGREQESAQKLQSGNAALANRKNKKI